MQALVLRPLYAEARFHCANTLQCIGRLEESIEQYVLAIELNPDYAVALMNLGNVLQSMGKLEEAVERYEEAIALRPDFAEAHMNLGNVLQAQGKQNEALARYVKAFAFKPNYAEAYVNLGNLLQAQGQLDEAITEYEWALTLRADQPEALLNLGAALEVQGKHKEAVARYEQAICLRAGYAEAHLNLALNRLKNGDYAAGFLGYEWRPQRRQMKQAQWLGEPLEGRTILLHSEQGLGDCIQFLRYVPLLKNAGGRVIIEVPRCMRRLIGDPSGVEVVDYGSVLPPFDVHCPLMSLPLACGTTVETIPAGIPYLQAAKREWQGWRVGLVWAGNPQHRNDRNRSIPLEALAPLLGIGGVEFYSLQVGKAAGQLAGSGFAITDWTPRINDMADTAELLCELDLLITVDTAVAHLAGALGRPVWILLAQNSDWRWMLERSDSPWYPTARLFRQAGSGVWSGVVQEAKLLLENTVLNSAKTAHLML